MSPPPDEFDGLRFGARIAAAAGAVVAEALMLFAGRHNTHYEITALFIAWVGSPFVLLWAADRASATWPRPLQTTLTWLMLIVTSATIAAYVRRILRPPSAQAAFIFVLVPPVSWLIIVGALGIAFAVSRGRPR